MSKWVNTEKFEQFAKQKQQEEEKQGNGGGFYSKWPNPAMGTQDKPQIYKIRLIPDKNGDFYKKYFYHFFKSGDKANYFKCPKTEDLNNYCPWCQVAKILYQGSEDDKKKAKNYSFNARFAANAYIYNDPRDANTNDDQYKHTGKVKLYEFPKTIESKIKSQVTDPEDGRGYAIFDPEEGYNLIIKVAAKPPDQNGRVWPDYSATEFSPNKNALGSEEEIKEIMNSVYDLTEYLSSIGMEWDKHKQLLKQEMLWEDVESDFVKYVEGKSNQEKIGSVVEQMDEDPFEPGKQEIPTQDNTETNTETNTEEKSNTEENKKSNDGDISDEDLLNEIENL